MPVPLPPTPHVAKITLVWQRAGSQLNNVFYIKDGTDAIFADPDGVIATAINAVQTHLLPAMYLDCQFVGVQFEDVRTVPFGGTSGGPASLQVGALATSGNFPNSVTFAIKKNTGNLGRSGRGRWYWASMDAADLTNDNTLFGARVTTILGALLAFQGAIEGGTHPCQMGINSYYTGNVLRAAGLFQRIVSWQAVDNVVDNQRRRLPGRGR